MTDVLVARESSAVADTLRDPCQCDDCRIERAQWQWYDTWCGQANRREPPVVRLIMQGARLTFSTRACARAA
jgi:hypothetical protein